MLWLQKERFEKLIALNRSIKPPLYPVKALHRFICIALVCYDVGTVGHSAHDASAANYPISKLRMS